MRCRIETAKKRKRSVQREAKLARREVKLRSEATPRGAARLMEPKAGGVPLERNPVF